MTTIGVLCARVRVEEKQLMAALAEAGAVPTPLPPASVPLPVGPLPPGAAGHELAAIPGARLIVDRCQDRGTAAAILTACSALGAATLDAGVAATGDRLAVAAALSAAALPRPETRLVCAPEAALTALMEFGYPGTLLPLASGVAPVTLLDQDAAEAVVEHRSILGSSREALALVQAGAPDAAARATITVVDGRAVAVTTAGDSDPIPATASTLAEAAATALGAGFVAIEIAMTPRGPLVWDVQAVPEFRDARPLAEVSVATALAAAIMRRVGTEQGAETAQLPLAEMQQIALNDPPWVHANGRQEVADGAVLSA